MSEENAEVVEEVEETEVEETTEEVETVEAEADTEKPQKGVTKRIDELTRNWRETERDRDYWRDKAMSKETKPEPVTQDLEFKTLEDFDYDETKFQKHMAEVITNQAKKEALEAVKTTQAETSKQQQERQFLNKEAEFAKDIDDYHMVTRSRDFPVSDQMFDVVSESDDGPAVLYYLGKNIDLARQINSLPPIQMARELGKLEAKVIADRSKKGESVSKAPPPPPKIAGTSATVEKDPDKMSTSDWVKWREKQLAKQG